jgi:carbamoyltransferase
MNALFIPQLLDQDYKSFFIKLIVVFAAIVLEEDANIYFDMLGLKKSECMTNSFYVREKYKDKLPGIVHVDGSCRVQTIDETSNLYELLIKFKEKT